MARKTKKEKIIADLRRKLAQANPETKAQEVRYNLQNIAFPKKIEEQPLNSVPEKFPQSDSIYIYPTQLIRKDLTKTLTLAILAISLELALFFIFEKKINIPTLPLNLPISFSFK